MTINDVLNDLTNIGAQAAIITGSNVQFESAVEEFNINDGGSLQLSWTSATGGGFPVGTEICGYILDTPYVPSYNSDGTYRYDLKLKNKAYVRLSKKLFIRHYTYNEDQGDGTTVARSRSLFTFNYTGRAGTLVADMHGVTLEGSLSDMVISVAFDGDYIKGAAQKVADALGATLWFDGTGFHIGVPDTYLSSEYYDKFYVFGGTKNMTKRAVTMQGTEYAAVTQRLMLERANGDARESYIGDANGIFEKVMIFDDIYPRVLMRIQSVRTRTCRVLNNEGNPIEDENGNELLYHKFYITMANAENVPIDQSKIEELIVDGTTLRMRFIPYTESLEGVSVLGSAFSPLAGREFELAHYTKVAREWEADDVLVENGAIVTRPQNDPFIVQAGEYCIVYNADGNTILPNATLAPEVGNLVYLVNVAVPEGCKAAAQARLLTRATEATHAFSNSTAPHTSTETASGSAVIIKDDQLCGQTTGDSASGIVTSRRTDLITGEVQVTRGNFEPKGLISTMIDKVEGVQTSGGGGTKGEGSDDTRSVGTMSQEQWEALAKAGGRKGMVALNKRVTLTESEIASLGVDLQHVQLQADESFSIWYGFGVPTASNYPASEWDNDALRELHLEDIYADYNREPASAGGRFYKWTKSTVNGVTTYAWADVTDADTIMALEKISDIAGDGVITGGAEKQRLYVEWYTAVQDYQELLHAVTAYSLTQDSRWTAYNNAFGDYCMMLDGGDDSETNMNGMKSGTFRPLWLLVDEENDIDNMAVSHALSDFTMGGEELTPELYRSYITAYKEKAAILWKVIDVKAKEALDQISDMGSDSKLTPDEKVTLKRDFVGYLKERRQISAKLQALDLTTERSAYNTALNNIAKYLNGGNAWAVTWNNEDEMSSPYPRWISDDVQYADVGMSATNTIDPSTWRGLWTAFFEARTDALNAITAKAQETAQAALNVAVTSKKVFVKGFNPDEYEGNSIVYREGDTWYNTVTGETWVCISSMEETFDAADWKPQSSEAYYTASHNALADFVVAWEEFINVYFAVNSSATSLKVCVKDEAPEAGDQYDVWVNVTAGTILWPNLHGNIPSWNTYSAMLLKLFNRDILEFSVRTTLASQASKYDVHYARSTFHDNFMDSDVVGGLNVWVYTGEMWKKVQDGTSGLMENYGDRLIATIFGNAQLPQGLANFASGLVTQMNQSEMFAKAVIAATGQTVLAAIKTIIDMNQQTGQPSGRVKITADMLQLDSGFAGSGVMNMNAGNVETLGLGSVVSSGFELKETENAQTPMAALKTIVLKYSIGMAIQDYLNRLLAQGDKIKMSVLLLTGETYANDARDHDENYMVEKGATVITPYECATKQYKILKYVLNTSTTPYTWDLVELTGASGTFTSADNKTITVTGGIITGIS